MLPLLLALLTSAAPLETTALSVDVHFRCPSRVKRSLVLTPETQALLEIPEGCPDAGRPWRLMLRCKEGRCTGAVLAEQGSIARVHGPPSRLAVTPLAREHPLTLGRMSVSVRASEPLRVDAEDRRERPLQLHFQAPTFAVQYTLDTVVATPLPSPRKGSPARLVVQVARKDLDRVQVRLWNERQELLVDRALRLDEPLALACAKTAGWCTGALELRVREHPPR